MEKDTPCTSILLVVERVTPCTSTLVTAKMDTPLPARPNPANGYTLHIMISIYPYSRRGKGIHPPCLHCWRWRGMRKIFHIKEIFLILYSYWMKHSLHCTVQLMHPPADLVHFWSVVILLIPCRRFPAQENLFLFERVKSGLTHVSCWLNCW